MGDVVVLATRAARVVAAAVLVTVLTVLTGCSGDGDQPGPRPSGAGSSPATAPSGGGAQPEAADQLTVAASREASVDFAGVAVPVRADLAPLRRNGDVVVLNLTLTNLGEDRWQISADLDDGTTNGIEGGVVDQDPARYSVDGISLVDGVNGKRHLVARDERGYCVCSTALSGVFLEAGGVVVLSATFAAPPDDVTAMDVEVPLFGTFTGVPVES